jgi:hypothetical protein
MHYTPNVELAFNSVEHTPRMLVVYFLCAFLLFKVNIFKNYVLRALKLRNISTLQSASQLPNLIIKSENTKSKNLHKLNTEGNLNSISDESFFEWFRGLTDGEGCFEIISQNSKFYFRFSLYMHKDDSHMLNYVCSRLKVGKVIERAHFTTYSVTSADIFKIIEIFDKYPLNTSKHLNYLALKEGFLLYNNCKDTKKVLDTILALKNSMNKKRVLFELPSSHSINITPYWLLGFVEAEGYFSVATAGYHKLEFGIGQTLSELPVLEAIKQFLLNLPGSYDFSRSDTNPVGLNIETKPKNEKSKPMAKIQISKTDYINNVLVPFFDSLN